MSGRKSDVKERACSNGSLESLVHLQNVSFNKSACSIYWDFFFFFWKYFRGTMWCYSMGQNAFVQYLGTEVDSSWLTWNKAFLIIAMNILKIIHYFELEKCLLNYHNFLHSPECIPLSNNKKKGEPLFRGIWYQWESPQISGWGLLQTSNFKFHGISYNERCSVTSSCKVKTTRIFIKLEVFQTFNDFRECNL